MTDRFTEAAFEAQGDPPPWEACRPAHERREAVTFTTRVTRMVCRYCGWPVDSPDERDIDTKGCCGESWDHVAIEVSDCRAPGCTEYAEDGRMFCEECERELTETGECWDGEE